jgi:hypothetical protein
MLVCQWCWCWAKEQEDVGVMSFDGAIFGKCYCNSSKRCSINLCMGVGDTKFDLAL